MNGFPKPIEDFNGQWDAAAYFRNLTERNRLADSLGFRFCVVSDLQGFEDALASMQSTANFICVSDISDGTVEYDNHPMIRSVKTVFMAMRHSISETADVMGERMRCFATMREIFRQFVSTLLPEQFRLSQCGVAIDRNIRFSEIPRYFFSGCACAYFQIAVTAPASMTYRKEEWKDE